MAVLAIKIIFHKKEFLNWKKKLVIKIKKADDGGGRDPFMGRRRSNLIFSGWRKFGKLSGKRTVTGRDSGELLLNWAVRDTKGETSET